jgi:hypothetical protein
VNAYTIGPERDKSYHFKKLFNHVNSLYRILAVFSVVFVYKVDIDLLSLLHKLWSELRYATCALTFPSESKLRILFSIQRHLALPLASQQVVLSWRPGPSNTTREPARVQPAPIHLPPTPRQKSMSLASIKPRCVPWCPARLGL